MNNIMRALEEDIRKSREEEATRLGVSVEEIERREHVDRERANREYQEKIKREAAEREARFQAALDSPDETIPATRNALSKVLKWTSSRYNPNSKPETIDRILALVNAPEDVEVGRVPERVKFECGGYTPHSSMTGYDYTLVIDHRGATLVANFGYPSQRVYRIAQ